MDFHNVLANIAKELKEKEVEDLAYRFHLKDFRESTALTLFNELERKKTISPGNTTPLKEKLEDMKLPLLAQKLVDYKKHAPPVYSKIIGREDELDQMDRHINECENTDFKFRGIFVTGMPGIGKTTLVGEFLRRCTERGPYSGIFISCRGLSSASSILEMLMEKFEIGGSPHDFYQRLEKHLIVSNRHRMIVLDNVEDVLTSEEKNFDQLLRNFGSVLKKNKTANSCLLVTSRKQLSQELQADSFYRDFLFKSLERMSEKDSIRLITSHLRGKRLETDKKERLMVICGQHPLAMTVLTQYWANSQVEDFSLFEEKLRNTPLPSITQREKQLMPEDSECIKKSLFHVFENLSEEAKLLLVRLCTVSYDVSDSVVEKLSHREKYSEELSCALVDLIEFSLISARAFNEARSAESEVSHRYSMHMLIKQVFSGYCESNECPLPLKQTYKEAQKRLLAVYRKEIIKLSEKEFTGKFKVKALNRRVQDERLNFTPKLPDLLDDMIESSDAGTGERTSLNDFEAVCRFRNHLLSNRLTVANFYRDRKMFAKDNHHPKWIEMYFELQYADAIRIAGDTKQAGTCFSNLKVFFESQIQDETCPDRYKTELKAHYYRYYGRYLKDLPRQEDMKEAIRYLKLSLETFEKLTASGKSPLIELYHDLGNAYKMLADEQHENKKHLRLAKESFERARKICEERNPDDLWLFDLHLSLAAVEMELKSGADYMATGLEDRTTLSVPLAHYEEAERIAKRSGDVIGGNDAHMGDLNYARAVCHMRAGNYRAALNDARKALKMQKKVYDCHPKIMNIYTIIGYICSSDSRIRKHNDTAFKYLTASFEMAKRLSRKGVALSSNDVDALREYLWMVSYRVGEDFDKYEGTLKEIKANRLNNKEYSESLDENEDVLLPIPIYEESDSSDNEDGERAPSVSDAKKLGEELKELLDENAEPLLRIKDSSFFDFDCYPVRVLLYAYPNMTSPEKIGYYQKGEALLKQLKSDLKSIEIEQKDSSIKQWPLSWLIAAVVVALIACALMYLLSENFLTDSQPE